jgi:hypothetical protein
MKRTRKWTKVRLGPFSFLVVAKDGTDFKAGSASDVAEEFDEVSRISRWPLAFLRHLVSQNYSSPDDSDDEAAAPKPKKKKAADEGSDAPPKKKQKKKASSAGSD